MLEFKTGLKFDECENSWEKIAFVAGFPLTWDPEPSVPGNLLTDFMQHKKYENRKFLHLLTASLNPLTIWRLEIASLNKVQNVPIALWEDRLHNQKVVTWF